MQRVLAVVAVILCVLAVQVGTAEAVSADSTGLGFDEAGRKIEGTAKNVVVPVLVVVGFIILGCTIWFGGRAAGFAVKTVLACVIFVVAITGIGLQTMFPGLITSVIFP
jgi:hypothetical protein